MSNMFGFFAQVSETDVELKAITDAIDELTSYEVLVGIPDDGGSHTSGGSAAISNAELLYIHTNGSPINNIPPRPVIEPAIENNKEQVSMLLQNAADFALNGNKAAILPALEKAGMYGQNIARAWFTNPANGWPELKKSTIKARRRRMSKGKRQKADEMIMANGDKTSAAYKPLIDTGELRKSITYKVDKV